MRTRMTPRLNDFMFLAAGSMVGVLLLVGLPLAVPAQAVSCAIAGAGWEGDPSQSVNHFGAKVGNLLVTSPSASCPLIRSTTVWNTAHDFAEVGWYIDSSGFLTTCDTYSTPHFYQYARVSGGIDCAHPSNAVSGTITVLVKSPNHDTVWDFYLNGTLTGHFNTNVTSGSVFATSERHVAGENLNANFGNLSWFGSSGSWNAWSELTGIKRSKPGDNVSDYSFCTTSGVTDAFTVKTSC